MTYTSLTDADLQTGKPVKATTMQQVDENLDDVDSRISDLELSGNVTMFSEIIDVEPYRVGETRWSFLTESQFQDRYGVDWVQINGASISGSDLAALYGSTLPDFRDRFPRISGVSHSLGATEANQMGIHNHRWYNAQAAAATTDNAYDSIGNLQAISTSATDKTTGRSINIPTGNVHNMVDQWTENESVGTSETRPDSGVLNCFVKKSDHELDYIRIYRAPANLDIVSATISSLVAGSAGSLTVDILKGSALGSLTTMLNSDISLVYSTGNYATSSEASFATTAMSQNDFIVVNVNSLQTSQTKFFLNLYAQV